MQIKGDAADSENGFARGSAHSRFCNAQTRDRAQVKRTLVLIVIDSKGLARANLLMLCRSITVREKK